MPFARDTLAQIQAKTAADIQSALPGSDPLLRNAVLGIIGRAFSEIQNSLYGYLDYIARQSVPYTAEGEAFYAWAALKQQFPKAATPAKAAWTFPCVLPATIEAGQVITRSDGAAYTVDATVAAAGATVTVQSTAVDAGSAGTVATGAVGVLASPVANVTAQGSGTAVSPGTDLEAFDSFKTRVLAIYGEPPQGGDAADYVEWALAVPGVTRAWCAPLGQGAGTVVVYFMMDLAEEPFGGFPQGTNGVAAGETRDAAATGDQLVVADYIFGPDRQPVTALVYACAPGQNQVDFTLKLAGATPEVKAAVESAIAAVFLAKGSPGGVRLTADQVALGQTAGVVNLSDIEAAISVIGGAAGILVTADSCSHGSISPASPGNIVSNTGYLPVMGVVTWT